MARRLALVIATYQYEDAGLRRLTAPARDAESFAAVLRDPDIAGFEVTTLINEPYHRVGEVIGDFYRDRRRDDLTLLYFTGHGLKDDDGRLYLAMANTRRDSLLFTSLPAEQIDYAMSGCVSRQKVLILDCCYSGAFPAGRLAKADTEVHALERFQGRGRTVLTASDSMQYSFEGNQLHGDAAQSVFTRYLVAGLRDGSADLDGDGDITLDELYSYVYDRVVEEMPQQRPKKQDNVEGRIIIARNINWSLPAYLRNALNSPIATDRLGALDGLDRLYRNGNDVVRDCVRDEIQHLADDDSRLVSAAADTRLRSLLLKPLERPVEQEPEVSKLQAKRVPEPRAVGATTPPTRQTRSPVPDAMPVQPPAVVSSTTTPPRQPAREPRSAPPSIASGPEPSKKPFWPERRYVTAWAALAAVIPLTAILVLTFSNEEESAAGGGSETSAASEPESSSSAAPSGEGVTTIEDIFGPACSQAPTEGMVDDPVGTAASNNPLLTTLTQTVIAANLVDILNDPDAQYTVFAPANSAFEELEASSPGITDALLAEPEGKLTTVLTYHLIPQRYDAQGLVDAGSVQSVQGMVEITGTPDAPVINGSTNVACGNIPTANATVFVIDSVLMPPAA